MSMLLIVGAVSGACVGSAAGVAVRRWPDGASMSRPRRSVCDHCGRKLAPWELIPVLSWVMLRGRCRTCRAPIAAESLYLELGCAVLVVATLLGHRLLLAVPAAVVGCGLLVATSTDLRAMIVPDRLTKPLGLFAVASSLALTAAPDAVVGPWRVVVGALGVPILLRLATSVGVRLTGRVLLGGGDIKLLVSLLAILVHVPGGPLLLALFSLVPAGVLALVGLVSGRLSRGQALPFVPFLLLGWVVAMTVEVHALSMVSMLASSMS
jgi:leader peptidase (prepilin peptidase) / N-methyltransferase